jgi:chemotaxis signal transduction protein
MTAHPAGTRAVEMRERFDRSFAEPVSRDEVEYVELLAIRAGGRPYALRLGQTSALHPDRPVTPLPGPLGALLGVAGFGGTVVPVYDLATLLGHPAPARPRWLVLAAGDPPLAFAFHELDGHARIPVASIITETGEGRNRGSLRGMALLADGIRPIADLTAARAAVHSLAKHADSGERQT